MRTWTRYFLVFLVSLAFQRSGPGQNPDDEMTYRLYDGITLYVWDERGVGFDVKLALRDLNLYGNGPREVLYKIYDPEGRPVVREIIPDDGVVSEAYLPPLGGWDHELQYYILCYSRGLTPMIRWSAYSDPRRRAAVASRTFARSMPGGKPGIYRIVLAGERDHVATVELNPKLPHGVCGHHTFLHGHGDQWRKSFLYVPKGTVGLHLAFAEPDEPRSRRFTLSAADGRTLYDGSADGGFVTAGATFKPGELDGQLLRMEVSPGLNDFLMKVTMQRAGGDYVGLGSEALFVSDEGTARGLHGGAIERGEEVFWHPFQVRLHEWLEAHALDEALGKEIRDLAGLMRFIGPSDGRGCKTWTNWAYAFGYYGCKMWRPAWLLMKRADVPEDLKAILREGLLVGGDRLSFAVGIERVNGNAFAQIPVALWYCHQATGDAIQKERFETFFERWRTEGWGKGSGISRSGDSQEHFAHSANYGWYILENWSGGIWVKPGILDDTDDPRFRAIFDRARNLFSYLSCPEAPANPWSSRTQHGVHPNWQSGGQGSSWKGDPGPDFTVSVNGGNEWFAARRKSYYVLTFHGRLPPEWLCNTFHGQIGFGGGAICQLTVPGKGTVLASTQNGDYGKEMHLGNWRNFHLHSLVGEMWDGQPLVAAVSEHADARLEGETVTSSGEVRGRPIRVERKFQFGPEAISCEVRLDATSYAPLLTLWSGERLLSHVREAYEMLPFLPGKVTWEGPGGQGGGGLGSEAVEVQAVIVDRGKCGVRIELDRPRRALVGSKDTVWIEVVSPGSKPVPAKAVSLGYRLMPYSTN
ncbi:MAG: hypothetical protein HYU36_11040 [Planctomycetes bacterium]|nr:hypothetical protein [Planctomycetota bacterium]